MEEKPLIVVIGVTGKQGGAVARHLLRSGKWNVAGISRKPEGQEALETSAALGIKILKADTTDKQALVAAFRGAYGVFGVTNPFAARWNPLKRSDGSVEDEMKQGRNIVSACMELGVKHLVFSSVASALDNTGIATFEAKAVVERFMKSSGYNNSCSVVAPAGFMDNIIGPFGVKQGVVPTFLKEGKKAQMIATDDIGWFVNMMFDDPERWKGQRLEIAGEAVSAEDQVAILSRIRKGEAWKVTHVPDWVFKVFIPKAVGTLRDFLNEKGTKVDIARCRELHPGMQTFEAFLMVHGMDKKQLSNPSSCTIS